MFLNSLSALANIALLMTPEFSQRFSKGINDKRARRHKLFSKQVKKNFVFWIFLFMKNHILWPSGRVKKPQHVIWKKWNPSKFSGNKRNNGYAAIYFRGHKEHTRHKGHRVTQGTQGDTSDTRGHKETQGTQVDTKGNRGHRDKGGQKGHEGIQRTQGDTRDIEDRGNTRDTGGHKQKPGTGKKPKRCHKKAMKPIKVFMQYKKTGERRYVFQGEQGTQGTREDKRDILD